MAETRRGTVTKWRAAMTRLAANPHRAGRTIRLQTDAGGVVLGFGARHLAEEQPLIWGRTTEGGWEVQLPSDFYSDVLHLLQTEAPMNVFVEKDDAGDTVAFEISTGFEAVGEGLTDTG